MSTKLDVEKADTYKTLRLRYYILSYLIGYIFPIVYFIIKLGVTKEKTTVVLPVLIAGLFAIIKITMDVPRWVATWEPSFTKGMVKALPKLLIFIFLITFGVALMYVVKERIDLAFKGYFETVFVLFGGQSVGSIFAAFHLKYKELYLMSKGYVLGVVNK